MWSNLRAFSANLLRCPEWAPQSKRTTYILRRKKPVRLNKLGAPFPKKLLRREYYYEVVQDTHNIKSPLLKLVLTKDVAGVGMKGEKVEMNMFIAYRDLLLPKLAVDEASPEAQMIMKTTDEKHYSSIYSKIVENYLAGHALKIIMSYETSWTLQPWHVKCALRQIGVIANDDCIRIPKVISGPDMEIENKDFIVYLTMNKVETFPVRCRIYHWSNKEFSLNQKPMNITSESEALFPDEKEKILSLWNCEKEILEKGKLTAISGGKIKKHGKKR